MSIANPRETVSPARSGAHRLQAASATRTPAAASGKFRRRAIIGGVLLAAVITPLALREHWPRWGEADVSYVLYTTRRGDLEIKVTERGNLESQDNVQVLCEVDDIRGDNIDGTPIMWIIPNGSSVSEGDLLVELESASHLERLDQQMLLTERARAEHIQAAAQYENQISQNETDKANAELAVKLADLELEMFDDEENGTHKLEVEAIKRSIDDVNNEILAAQASLELKRNEKLGIESLFKLGYAGKSELDRARLDFLQAEASYAAKMNRLETELATLSKKETYERQMQELTLQGKLETAKRELSQVIVTNDAQLEQAKAAMDAASRSLEKEEELLARYKLQLEKTKIYAPQDGMVAYAVGSSRWSRSQTIAQGTPVSQRQHIMSLPNLKKMQVKTAVHESVLDQISPGLPATVRLDAYHDRTYSASVMTVAVLPDQGGWMSSDTKVYETIVTIDEEVSGLKPGMTAVVDIHVCNLQDVISVPVQSIVQLGHDTWCYVKTAGGVEKRPVTLGLTNDKYVEVREGLIEGEQVVLNPMSVPGEANRKNQSPDANNTQDSDKKEGDKREEHREEQEVAPTSPDSSGDTIEAADNRKLAPQPTNNSSSTAT
ncbi:MAG: efflux RND transporter periplasmic adaptor subunit [Pirellulaceae bacterium]|nr:efflux RND transporter periplasmic adaptor subunit [Planctomycetales bacterium]